MDSPDQPSSTRSFKRSYVACISCRTRKSRCVIKDNPPCAKCAREHRECQFDRKPRVAKHRDAPKWTAPPLQTFQTTTNQFPPQNVDFNLSPDNNNHPLYGRVQSTIVTGVNDALDFLSDAAAQHSSAPSQRHPPASNVQSNGPQVVSNSNGVGFTITALSEPDDHVLDMWDRCRFVRQGWFTAQEAVTYIDLFFDRLAPLSPVILDQFRSHVSHQDLVYKEAMLCCTLLMISSRFFTLPGAGGASRGHYIHQRLWNHCEVLIRRILLGQEKVSTSQTRTVGTIESLILISDWHPRALHFPPETDGWDGLLVTPGYDRINRKHVNNEVPLIRWREDVFEPAKRANRMSWMLLGMANNLAHELGIFSSQYGDLNHPSNGEALRGLRAQKLLYKYLTETSVRLGYSSVLPEGISVTASRLNAHDFRESDCQYWLSYMDLSLELTQLSRTAYSMFFHSASHLQTQLLDDHYVDLLEHFFSSLSKWQERFETVRQEIALPLRDILAIDFHHLKACTSAISIQAVIARASSAGSTSASPDPNETLSAFITSKDSKFLQEVISNTKKVLHTATLSDFKSHLLHAPARVKISVISSSVFLLKALSVGSTHTDVNDALYTLDQCTSILKSSPADDMDFALRYADLIEKHTSQFRAHLTQNRDVSSSDHSGRASVPRNITTGQVESSVDSFLSGLDPNQNGDDGGPMKFDAGDTWISLPFDLNIAPFGEGCDQVALGLDVDALDFLWSLPELVQGETGFA
ncbi:hypothetical protein FLONG3_529 [Fusarium longipes]|uniref:Zn(2)-C6 fungal-type domain-containing protein n=1 Tax=Fusarium longipes TaxID=694270 RepID=A0A395TAX5_9HYPO|nr:hypothetical protein FLONG3_529 [Fusarium longipes]